MSSIIKLSSVTAPKISFQSFAIYVIDLEESRLFYRRLGFRQGKYQDAEEYTFITMKAPGRNGVDIELRESSKHPEYAGRVSTVFALDIDKKLNDDLRLESEIVIIEDLLLRGFNFANLTAKEFYFCRIDRTIEMVDPQGAWIEILLSEH